MKARVIDDRVGGGRDRIKTVRSQWIRKFYQLFVYGFILRKLNLEITHTCSLHCDSCRVRSLSTDITIEKLVWSYNLWKVIKLITYLGSRCYITVSSNEIGLLATRIYWRIYMVATKSGFVNFQALNPVK